MPRTERLHEDAPAEASSPRAWLVQVGRAQDPLEAPSVIELEGKQRLVLGRKEETTAPGRIDCADRWMSFEHAELKLGEEGWVLNDLGSSNGTLIFGRARSQHVLRDGDMFETGSTFWIFRHRLAEQIPTQPDDILGSLSDEMAGMQERITKVARTRVPVMILGETGTGKEVLARRVHELSGRTGPFVAINTAAVQQNLVASELFGVEKGAHSTAEKARRGQIRAGHEGTVLLDEIGDMPLEVQVSLLRVIQESEVLPVGGDLPVAVDVRFICATHRELSNLVEVGGFRADLLARLKGAVFDIPSLADRPEDIGALIANFLRKLNVLDLAITPAAYRAMLSYPWPLNVRELEKVIETAVALIDRDKIEIDNLPPEVRNYTHPRSEETERAPSKPEDRRAEVERLLLAQHGNVTAVARSMGYSRMQVHRWIKEFDLDPAKYRK